MKIFIFFLLFSFSLFSQFEQKEGFFYTERGDDIEECIEVEYFDKTWKTYEKGLICRETKWRRKYHQGTVWEPSYTDGTWKPLRNQTGYYWIYYWTDWKFKKI
jgi:hypothetical protein